MGLGDLLEALLGLLVVGVGVGVVLARELAVGLLDLLGGRFLVDPERLVVVGTRCHLSILLRLSGDEHPRRADDARAQPVAGLVDLDDAARSQRPPPAAGRPPRARPGRRCRRPRRRTRSRAAPSPALSSARTRRTPSSSGSSWAAASSARSRLSSAGKQLLGELRHAALLRRGGLARDALAVVLEVGLRALREREVLVALAGDARQLVELSLELPRPRHRPPTPARH